MNELLQNLLRLQALQFGDLKVKNIQSEITALRARIPLPILGHYDRFTARGKRGVAVVRDHVCTGCHMRQPIGVIATIMRAEDVQLCEFCGRYLYLPDPAEEKFLVSLEQQQPAARKASRRHKVLAHAA